MVFFNRRELDILRESMKNSFHNVRQDMRNMADWIQFLHQENRGLQEQNSHLQDHVFELEKSIKKMPSSPEEIRKIIDEHYMWGRIRDQLKRIEEKIVKKQEKQPETPVSNELAKRLDQISTKIEDIYQRKQGSSLQRKIAKKVTRNAKDYVKNVLQSLIHKYEKVSALHLREMVVEEQGLVSKSSFYRLLSELEESPDISVVQDGKEKIYFSKMAARKLE